MRPVARNLLVAIGVVAAALLALGALPSLLASGDPYYLTAERVEGDHAAVAVTDLSERRYPYTTAALETGRSSAYYEGPFGLKEAFSHSPFDELAALRSRNASAAVDGAVYVRDNGTLYRLALRRPA